MTRTTTPRYRIVQRQRNGKRRPNANWHYQHEGQTSRGRTLCAPPPNVHGIYADEYRWVVGAEGQQATCPRCIALMARLVALIPKEAS